MAVGLGTLLALLPDNTEGAIGADDVRAAVTELYRLATQVNQVYSYKWVASVTPTAGEVHTPAWNLTPTKIYISETTNEAQTLSFVTMDASTTEIWLSTVDGAKFRATVTGPTVDSGTFREVPITVDSASGTPPSAGEQVLVTLRLSVEHTVQA